MKNTKKTQLNLWNIKNETLERYGLILEPSSNTNSYKPHGHKAHNKINKKSKKIKMSMIRV